MAGSKPKISMPKFPAGGHKTMEVDMTWLDPEERAAKKRPPPIPGSNLKAPPMPVLEPVRRETMEVRAEWLDHDPKSRKSMLPVKITDPVTITDEDQPKPRRSRSSMAATQAPKDETPSGSNPNAGNPNKSKGRTSMPPKGTDEPKRRASRASLAPVRPKDKDDSEPKPRKTRNSLVPVKPKDKKAPPIPREE